MNCAKMHPRILRVNGPRVGLLPTIYGQYLAAQGRSGFKAFSCKPARFARQPDTVHYPQHCDTFTAPMSQPRKRPAKPRRTSSKRNLPLGGGAQLSSSVTLGAGLISGSILLSVGSGLMPCSLRILAKKLSVIRTTSQLVLCASTGLGGTHNQS